MASAAAAVMPQPVASSSGSAMARNSKPVLTIDAANLVKSTTTSSVVVPTILITPPDTPPHYSSAIPEQQYEKSVLFVPVKTEELGWDEHGLYWNGTYAYPVHQIYDKEGRPIGRRRKGPSGYRFEEYYDNKKPRRCSQSEDAVEEASVRLEEPAPARIEKAAPPTAEQIESIEDEDVDMASPTSPTLSVASDMTETEDSSSFCDDSSSLWSRNQESDDDGESNCTSPGIMSPPVVDSDKRDFEAETLSKKLSDLPSAVTKNSWVSLGTLPSATTASAASSSRSQSLPTARKAKELSATHRASSTPIVDQRRHSTPPTSAYSSIIQDLTTSPFSSSSASKSASPFRSATLPRSSSRSTYSQNRGSLLRPPPSQYSSFSSNASSNNSSGARRANRSSKSSSRFIASSEDFSAGWSFESHSALLNENRWDDSFASHY
ncbi:uncharacterized protein UTRI_04491 [Ustilago trichophora]|uniref:Uncharacterized protein n=1 Tax=Ustilago trichophora TaxID=86804 RepID=A0A5C3ED92_9BASI|nr:uncharacterized protein UTRI_04491 [Ustilago trichophora]